MNRAGGPYNVLSLERGNERRAIEAEIGELLHRELDEDAFVLRPQHFDLRDVGNKEQLRANVFNIVAKLAMGEPVAGKTIDDSKRGAEVIIEPGPDDARGQGMANIADVLAHLIPGVRNLLRGRTAFQIDEDRGDARTGIAAQEVQVVGFLKFAFESLGDLIERVVDGRTGPCRLNHHRLDNECRVLAAAETKIGYDARRDGDHHEIGNERAVVQRPF